MNAQLKQLASQFLPGADLVSIKLFGSGHINDTYKVESSRGNFLLQRINHLVFHDIAGLTGNLIAVTDFLKAQLAAQPGSMTSLTALPAPNKKYTVKAADETYWRMFHFIENSFSFNRVTSEKLAQEGGKTWGWFVRMLDTFPAEELADTIPGFHNAGMRIANFRSAVEEDKASRLAGVKGLVDSLLERSPSMMKIHDLGKTGDLSLRVTHNDTKINNILFDANGLGRCVIDLDTVMPGYVHFDFGDAVRTFTNTGEEDDRDLDRVRMNLDYFEALSRGFLAETRDILLQAEIDTLAFSGKYITFEQCIRFLTDYLQGDLYYKTQYPDHNLVRALAQEKLLRSMEENFEAMEAIIRRYA